MKLNLSKSDEANKAETYFAKLVKDGAKIELRKINPVRSINQNSYVHCLFTLWGAEYGYTLDEAKLTIKDILGYTYDKHGQTFPMKTSTMNTQELSDFVTKLRNWSAAGGLYLPTADDYKLRNFEYTQEVDRAEQMQKRYSY